MVIENNVTDFVLGKAKVNEKAVSFDELMGRGLIHPGGVLPAAARALASLRGLQLCCTSPTISGYSTAP